MKLCVNVHFGIVPEMEDYKQLLQGISTLQPSRLGYIELLQEEVKRNEDVSDELSIKEILHVIELIINVSGFDFGFRTSERKCEKESVR